MKDLAVVCLLCVAAFAETAGAKTKPPFEFRGVRILAPVVAADIPKLKQEMNCDRTLGCAITVKDGKITYVYLDSLPVNGTHTAKPWKRGTATRLARFQVSGILVSTKDKQTTIATVDD